MEKSDSVKHNIHNIGILDLQRSMKFDQQLR